MSHIRKGAQQPLMPKDFCPSGTGLESPGHDPGSAQPRELLKSRFQPFYKQQK